MDQVVKLKYQIMQEKGEFRLNFVKRLINIREEEEMTYWVGKSSSGF